jgi:cytoskeleton protein RodZ
LVEIGAQLRQARLERGQSIAELSSRLNMGQEQLQALESANLAQLPEPVFVIAQIRRVASTLGVDLESSIQELRHSQALRSAAGPSADSNSAAQSAGGTATALHQRHPRRPWRRALAGVVAVPLLGWLGVSGWMHWQRTNQPKDQDSTAAASAPAPAAAAAQLTLSSRATSWLAVRDSTGTMLFEGNFTGRKQFPLGQGLAVLAGRPDLVLASRDGSTPEPLGPIEAVSWRRFSPAPQP